MPYADIADFAANLVLEAFDAFNDTFRAITRRARTRFEDGDWDGGRRDAAERLDAYERALNDAAEYLDAELGSRTGEAALWATAKPFFSARAARRYDVDRAETFFNSVTRKLLRTVGVDREAEFFHLHPRSFDPAVEEAVYRTYVNDGNTAALFRRLFADFPFRIGYECAAEDAERVAREIDLRLWPETGCENAYAIDVVQAVFYRNKEAYLVGRIRTRAGLHPLVIPLSRGPAGVYADTVLLGESETSVVFSFAYAYFFVDIERHDALIAFLRTLFPRAGLGALHTALGYNRHGKTEFYRELHRHVHVSKEQFVPAPGMEGAVVVAFTLPHFPYVFKVIKDRPCFLRSPRDTQKEITNERVRAQYDFVSHRDPAGRMVDTQEFENLRFRTKRFSPALLDEFAAAARRSVSVDDDHVVLRHMYLQTKVVPLPHYFAAEKNPDNIRRVLVDFGWFLKDIAASGVFPGDLFNTWNYGVTQWHRVVLYDYDDVLPLECVRFREKPAPRDEDEELVAEEDRIAATDEDFFVDEMERFSGIPAPLAGVFHAAHGDLFTLAFWNRLTARVRAGEIFDVIPYDRSKRFRANNRADH